MELYLQSEMRTYTAWNLIVEQYMQLSSVAKEYYIAPSMVRMNSVETYTTKDS